ncbi:hypothetical protein Tdes44962_MAKER07535 [Teratosphaeria destructans]|uniref:Uncharacterized protein n=1 Tax=Teratosphaeria destructans TaxID=418781 RepID=A0A9W7W662_9PEZI|nr:hypothetical protein Tdes44962_MAKER07535 [Teratosphaeria destructans]
MRVHDPPTSDLYQDALPRPRNTGRDDPPQRRRSAFDSTRPPTQRYARAPDDEDAFGSITPAPPTPPQRAVRNQNRGRPKLRDFDYDADPEDDELAPPRALWYESDDELGMSNVRPSRRNFGEVGLGYDRRFPHQPEPWMSGRLPRFRLPPYGGRQDRINNLAMPSRARPRPEMDSGGLGFEDDEDPLDGRPYRRGAGMGRAAGSRAGPWRRYHG